MYNQLILLGKFQKIVTQTKKKTVFLISFSNLDNDCHFVPIYVNGGVGKKLKMYCNINDTIGIKGHISTDRHNNLIIIGEKLTFLSSNKM